MIIACMYCIMCYVLLHYMVVEIQHYHHCHYLHISRVLSDPQFPQLKLQISWFWVCPVKLFYFILRINVITVRG